MQEDHRRTGRRAGLGVADVQDAGVDLLERGRTEYPAPRASSRRSGRRRTPSMPSRAAARVIAAVAEKAAAIGVVFGSTLVSPCSLRPYAPDARRQSGRRIDGHRLLLVPAVEPRVVARVPGLRGARACPRSPSGRISRVAARSRARGRRPTSGPRTSSRCRCCGSPGRASSTSVLRDHRVVLGVGVLRDVEVLLNRADPESERKRPLGADGRRRNAWSSCAGRRSRSWRSACTPPRSSGRTRRAPGAAGAPSGSSGRARASGSAGRRPAARSACGGVFV